MFYIMESPVNLVIPCSPIIPVDKTRMSQENDITSPPGSGRSKRSREESQSVAFANSIQGSANPSMQSTPLTPMSHPSAQESAILRIQETIVARQNELDKINMDLSEIKIKLKETSGVGMEKAEEYLRFEHQTLLTRLTQVGAEIQSLRELELRKTPQVAGTASMAREAAAALVEYRFGNSEKVMEIIESLEIEGMTQIPKIAQMFTLAGSIPNLRIPQKNGFVVLTKEFLTGSGIGRPDADTHLFIRQSVLEQFEFIEKTVIEEEFSGSIYGQPGTGKSTATYLYASTLCEEWNVIWIHLEWWKNSPDTLIKCVIMTGSHKKVASFQVHDFRAFLESGRMFIGEKEILILDGLTCHDFFNNLSLSASHWWRRDTTHRRLIEVSSMAAQGKYKPVSLERSRVADFLQISWSLEEYKEAIQNTDFSRSVDKFLDADPQPGDTGDEKVISKFYYSGGCARSMFQFSTLQVKKLIKNSIKSLPDKSRILNADTGCNSKYASHNLFNVFHDDKTELVSAYAALELALQKGPEYIISLAKNPLILKNPFIKGGFFELLFFSYAKLGKIPLQDKGGEKFKWECRASVTVFKPKSPNPVSCVFGEWLMPNIWNQGGYDGVYLDKTNGRNVIRFVQTTTRDSHDVKLQFFIELINKLKTSNVFDPHEVKIFFVVPTEKLASYKIGPILHPESLQTLCWPTSDDEVRKRIQILGLDFPVAY